jgi:hypothetical protein
MSRAHPTAADSACARASRDSGTATSLPAASSAACRARSGEAVLRSGSPMRPSSAASSDAASLGARSNAAAVTGAACRCRSAHAQRQAGQHAHRQGRPKVPKLAGRLQLCRMAAWQGDAESGHAKAQHWRAVIGVTACTQVTLPFMLIATCDAWQVTGVHAAAQPLFRSCTGPHFASIGSGAVSAAPPATRYRSMMSAHCSPNT